MTSSSGELPGQSLFRVLSGRFRLPHPGDIATAAQGNTLSTRALSLETCVRGTPATIAHVASTICQKENVRSPYQVGVLSFLLRGDSKGDPDRLIAHDRHEKPNT